MHTAGGSSSASSSSTSSAAASGGNSGLQEGRVELQVCNRGPWMILRLPSGLYTPDNCSACCCKHVLLSSCRA